MELANESLVEKKEAFCAVKFFVEKHRIVAECKYLSAHGGECHASAEFCIEIEQLLINRCVNRSRVRAAATVSPPSPHGK